jgi:drug/metabolite transporter (DMT)-like permease
MDGIAIALVLVAAFFHAGWNRLLHGTGDRAATMAVAGLTVGLLLLPATIARPPWEVAGLVALSGLAEAGYVVTLVMAYQRGALSVAYPVGRGTAPFLVTLGGWLVLGDPVRFSTLLGALALGAGLVVVALGGRRSTPWSSLAWAVACGACIAAYSVIDAGAVREVDPAGYLGPVMALSALPLLAMIRFDAGRLRESLRPGALVGVGLTAAYLLVLFAFRREGAGEVATLREISVLLAILLARDGAGRAVWVGGGLVVAGAILAAV